MVFPAKCPKKWRSSLSIRHWWLRRGVPRAHGAAAEELEGPGEPRSCGPLLPRHQGPVRHQWTCISMWMSLGEKSASEFYGSPVLFFSLKIGPGTLVLSAFFLSLDPRWCILPLMGLQALPTLKWRAGPLRRVCGFNEEPWMQTRIKHALKIPRSQPVLPPPASPPPDPGAQGQQKVTCQTDTPGNLGKGRPRGPRSTLWTCFLSA